MIAKAKQQGVPVIDYDRLTLGGGASYYVSFDNVAVGTAQGEGLVKCMKANGDDSGPVALLNGSPTDNNATLFKQGYEKAITDAGYTIAADQSVPDWDNTKAGTIFEQMFTKANGKFVGVDSANDGLGGAVARVLKREGATKDIPTTGQDATDEGLQRVLLGSQCMTVYKAIKKEADAASKLAIALAKGDTAGADALATGRWRTPRPSSRSRACCWSRRRSSRRTSRTSSRTGSPPRTRSAPRRRSRRPARSKASADDNRFPGTAARAAVPAGDQ